MPSRRPLVCHVIYRLAVGGLENGLVNLINNLPEGRYEHAIICVTEATDFRRRIRRANLGVYELHKRKGKDPGAYARMWQTIRRLRPHIVHTRNLPALDMLFPAWCAGAARFIHSEHGLDLIELDGKNRKYNRLRRLSRLVVDRYITVSRDLNGWLNREIGIPPSRLETVYNGVDTGRFTPEGAGREVLPAGFAPPGAIVIGTMGRLDPMKNQLALIEAVAQLLAAKPALRASLRLAIIGDGPQRQQIEAALVQADLRSLAWLPGFREDTPSLYRALDIFVLPSLREGISNTLLEAMASGRPVIAFHVGGNPEIVPAGIAGQLVAPQADAIAASLLDYIEHPQLMRAHGDGGRAHTLRNFSLEAMMRSYDRVYTSLLPKGRDPHG